jgi:microcin C transport system substrate-binding protein
MGRDITYVGMPPTGASTFPVQRRIQFDRITFKIYLDETSRLKGLTGEYDFLREFIFAQLERLSTPQTVHIWELVKDFEPQPR